MKRSRQRRRHRGGRHTALMARPGTRTRTDRCRREVFRWLVRYTTRRRHSRCRYHSPSTCESLYPAALPQAAESHPVSKFRGQGPVGRAPISSAGASLSPVRASQFDHGASGDSGPTNPRGAVGSTASPVLRRRTPAPPRQRRPLWFAPALEDDIDQLGAVDRVCRLDGHLLLLEGSPFGGIGVR